MALDWTGVFLTLGLYGVFLMVGWWAHRRQRSSVESHAGAGISDFLLAGRAMPGWMAVMTMTATWIDGGYLLGTAEYTYRFDLPMGLQGGICFGLSLMLGGILFARRMRRAGFTTMIDLFEQKFGERWSAVLAVPALLGELFWSAALLVSIGATLSMLIQMEMTAAILLAAGIVTTYTMIGGMRSVASTDALQLLLIPIGMVIALVYALPHVGGLGAALGHYLEIKPQHWPALYQVSGGVLRPQPSAFAWWDMTVMLICGGVPWNCYFQRVLSCPSPNAARSNSLWAGGLTMLMTIPPCLMGIVALAAMGPEGIKPASLALPQVLKTLTPYPVMLLGLAAIIGAVTSSFSASILSAGSMASWNIVHRLCWKNMSGAAFRRLIRLAVGLLGLLATLLALRVQSVAALWLFTADLVFVLLGPQMVLALFDPRSNLVGSVVGFAVGLGLRLAGGLSLETSQGVMGFGAQSFYQSWTVGLMGGDATQWVDAAGASVWLVRTTASLGSLISMAIASRLWAWVKAPPEAPFIETIAEGEGLPLMPQKASRSP